LAQGVELVATLEVTTELAIVRVAWLHGRLGTPFTLLARLSAICRKTGARRMRIEARIANVTLLVILVSRYGFESRGGLETLEMDLR